MFPLATPLIRKREDPQRGLLNTSEMIGKIAPKPKGQDPTIWNLVPADIEVRGNLIAKPLSWRPGDSTYAGVHWNVYDLLELKNARRMLVDGNIFEYSWPDSLDGWAIAFTPRNQSGGAPWSTVEDITFTNNIVRHATGAILIHGTDDLHPSRQTQRLLIQNNLFVDIGTFSTMPMRC